MKYKRYIYLVYDGLETTVFYSQVLALIQRLNKTGIEIDLVIFSSLRNWFFCQERARRVCGFTKGRVILFPRAIRNFLWVNSFLLFCYLIKDILLKKKILIHARGVEGTAVALPFKIFSKHIKIICDHRGASAEEYLFRHPNQGTGMKKAIIKLGYWQLKEVEKKALLKADNIFFVSHALKRYSQGEYYIPDDKTKVIPCCVNDTKFYYGPRERQAIRKKLNINSRITLVYDGSMKRWQLPLHMIKIFKIFKEKDKQSLFLIITQEQKLVRRLLAKEQLRENDDFIALALEHNELPQYLMAADMGFLLREDIPLNNVSCPTKFAEYLACGNLVLATKGVKDVTGLIQKYGFGVIIGDLDSLSAREQGVKSCLEMLRLRNDTSRYATSQMAHQLFSWERYMPDITKVY